MKRLLAVDDHEENLYLLKVLLESQGYEVELAHNGAEALESARRNPPDLIVADILMPVMDGFTLCRAWKADERLSGIPFIFYTATYTDSRDRDFALSLGADAFITKPAEPEDFMAVVTEVLEKMETRQSVASREPDPEAGSFLKQYSEALVRKLEDKMLQLEEANRALREEIAERQRAEDALRVIDEQLRQSQKMEAIGQLAGGIAHDFNNLLTAILGYSDMLLAGPQFGDPSVREDLQEIRHAAERASALTKQILAFSRRQTLQPQVVSLNDVLAGMEPLLRRTIGEDVGLVTVPDQGLGHAELDVHQFEQVLMNLALNARDAMVSGGRLTLETANVELDSDYCHVHPEAVPGSYVMLAVSDTGVGMDEATRGRIFEPFFTTKGPGEGTGLGLATVYGTVRQSNGSISVYSEPGRGTSFKIYLPRVAAAAPAASARPRPAARAGASETVLVVEDDSALRRLISRELESLGYGVRVAADAREALALLADPQQHLGLLLTDVVLPGTVQGVLLADQACELCPALPVIFMSGYTHNAITHAGRLHEGVNFLEKPFTAATLAAKVREVLDAGAQGPV